MQPSTCCTIPTGWSWPASSASRGGLAWRRTALRRSVRDGTERPWVGSRWFRAAQWLAGLAIVLFAVRSLVRNWEELRSQPLEWSVRPGWLLLSAGVVWLMYAVLIVAWRIMLAAWGQRLGGWEAARIWTVSSLGKYLPGKVWAIAGMAVMSQRARCAAGSARLAPGAPR